MTLLRRFARILFPPTTPRVVLEGACQSCDHAPTGVLRRGAAVCASFTLTPLGDHDRCGCREAVHATTLVSRHIWDEGVS